MTPRPSGPRNGSRIGLRQARRPLLQSHGATIQASLRTRRSSFNSLLATQNRTTITMAVGNLACCSGPLTNTRWGNRALGEQN